MADALQGTWVFNDTVDLEDADYIVNFDSNDINFTELYVETMALETLWGGIIYKSDSANREVYGKTNKQFQWTNDAYKTIAITSKLSEVTNGDALLTWLQANATKQAAPSPAYPKINSFTYHGKQINNINGKHIRYVHDKRAGMDNTYEMVYVVQLATPQNVTADGTTVSWDAVENATSYAVLADGSEIGTVEGTATMPAKGDLITIEDKQYRVLKTDGNIAEVLAMYNSATSQAFDTSGNSNVYANSSLDVYLSQTFYNSLSTTMQNAIVAKTFQQDSWKWSGGTSAIANYTGTYQTKNNYTLSLMSTTFGTSVSRKCYVLSCQDVIDYLEVTTSMGAADTTLTSENVWRMFWNQTTSPGSTYLFLRSANSNNSRSAFQVISSTGYLGSNRVSNTDTVRPAFQIDLSKILWSK